MSGKFDIDTNPYADDLLRLSLAPVRRYSRIERHALARITASKLYNLSLVHPHYTDWGFSTWTSKFSKNNPVEIDVIFDSDLPDLTPSLLSSRYADIKGSLIVLSVGAQGVTELFNGPSNPSASECVWRAIEQMYANESGDVSNEFGEIPPRSDDEVADAYLDDRGTDDRGYNGGGGGGGGPGGGGDAPNGIPGSGGVAEMINHPVLFSIERSIFDAILDQI